MQWHLSIVGLAVVACVTIVVGRRRRPPQTVEEKVAAARAAMRSVRLGSPRPHRGTFERGRGVPDRHSAAIAENVAYGDAASFESGGGGAY